MKKQTDLVVLGSGPGGYTAAFRAADLDKDKRIILVEQHAALGGVCLNVGCIPSKYYLHRAKVLKEASEMKGSGIDFGIPKIDATQLYKGKNSVVSKLSGGINFLRQKRKVDAIQGVGTFIDAHTLEVKNEKGEVTLIEFKQAIIAAGSHAIRLPHLPDDSRIMTSTGALELKDVPSKLLIIGGGIIGLEMATIYSQFGSQVTVVEMGDQIIPPADKDLVQPLHKVLSKQCEILLNTKVTAVKAESHGLIVTFEGAASSATQTYDRILCAVGRAPNSANIGAENIGLRITPQGFIEVDTQLRTNIPHIFAIGDITGQPMLAHKASAQAKIAAEVAAGQSHHFDPLCIPSVAYTDPELAWTGLTEKEAAKLNIPYEKGVFPWQASGRAMTQDATIGITKLLFDPKTRRVIGGGIVGAHAGELISAISTYVELGTTVEDIESIVHPHPTLSETVLQAAEVFGGTVTDLLPS